MTAVDALKELSHQAVEATPASNRSKAGFRSDIADYFMPQMSGAELTQTARLHQGDLAILWRKRLTA
jgi:CheY-like chemotaxis protein